MSETMHLTRNYEVSVWTLQDSFIAILGTSDARYKGRIQNPQMKLVNDGTQEFSFSIPMYLDDGITREVNPIWQDIYSAPALVGLRKIKVIFNKQTDVEAVFEFVITKVTKVHENDKPLCEISCEGLAFHELGKIGYKIELSTDVLVEENNEWYKRRPKYGTYSSQEEWQEAENAWAAEEPRETIDYWMHRVMRLDPYPKIIKTPPLSNELFDEFLIWSQEDQKYQYYTWDSELKTWKNSGLISSPKDVINSTKWYYRVDMDWSEYTQIGDVPRDSDKIYEEELTVAWTSSLLPKGKDSIKSYKEKTRIMDEKESNIYNLTQKLAETFGVFCRYEYTYDDNYHINSRTIIFYNKGIKDKERKFSFTYPYSSTKISREDDSIDLVTKMYVTAIDDQSSESGLVTIINSSANRTREDYLLNFDYLHEIKTISDEQYDAIKEYEINIRAINDALEPLQDSLLIAQDRLPKAEALLTTAKNAMQLDAERINNSKKLAQALDMSDGDADGYITVSGANAKSVVLLEESDRSYYFNAPVQGILPSSIVIYKKEWDASNTAGRKLGDLYTNSSFQVGVPEYDEFGDMIKLTNILKTKFPERNIVYITFKYSPKLYYEKIQKIWEDREGKDMADVQTYTSEVEDLKIKIESLQNQINSLIEEKTKLIKEFEHMMGPALREGYWTPDNYDTTTGEKYVDQLYLNPQTTESVPGLTEYISFIWDTQPFDDEQLGSYKLGVNMVEKGYPCILLNSQQINFIKENQDKPVGILYYDHKEVQTTNTNDPRYYRCLVIGASVMIQCILLNGSVQFGLVLTGTSNFTDDQVEFMRSDAGQAKLGYLQITFDDGEITQTPVIHSSISSDSWIVDSIPTIVYPRCKVSSLTLKNNNIDLTLSYNYEALENYEDYYVLQRIDQVNDAYQGNYYITLKPEVLLRAGTLSGLFAIRYCLSNASTAVYVDAHEILKENSKPKVTYTLDPNIFYENFTYTAYNVLNTIAFINDYELQFEGAQGYISSVDLNLDFPNEDTIEVKNYKNKFEDLFSTIVAQTQAMEKNESTFAAMTRVISADGSISAPALEGALQKVDLNYQFNQGRLTISEAEGIWGTSEDGVVAYRGGGIFTATQKDENGNWIWNTGIVPQGINANAITAGQLDTNKIKVYSGDRIRFQLNGDGLFAYKSLFTDFDVLSTISSDAEYQQYLDKKEDDANFAQYVTMNEDGLFLCARKGAYIVNSDHTNYRKVGETESGAPISNFPKVLNRVSISWDGFTIRNWNNERVFYADADTGNLTVSGTIRATGLFIKQGNSMQQVSFSVDPTNHKIDLSSTNFDNGGIKSSNVEIVPSGITIKSHGSISMNSSTLTMNSSSINMTGGNISLTGENSITLTSSGSTVSISPSSIILNAGSIFVKGAPIWERNDIIYSRTFPSNHPTDRAWLWVQPLGVSTVTYTMLNATQLSTAQLLNTPSSGAALTYTVSVISHQQKETNIESTGNGIEFSITNGTNTVNFPATQVSYGGGYSKSTTTWTVTTTINVCNGYNLNFTCTNYAPYNPVVDDVTLLVSAPVDESSSGSECRVYYYGG